MPEIDLPIPGEDPNWAPKLNAAVGAVNASVDGVPADINTRAGTSGSPLNNTIKAIASAASPGEFNTVSFSPLLDTLPDSTSEWHHRPITQYVANPWRKYFFGGATRSGDLLVASMDRDTSVIQSTVVGRVVGPPDDHKIAIPFQLQPAATAPLLAIWSNHGADNYIRLRRSLNSGVFNFGQEIAINIGGAASYVQAFQSDANTVWIFSRVTRFGWRYVKSTDKGATWSSPQQVWFLDDSQMYINMARIPNGNYDGGARVIVFGNPDNGSYHDVHTFDLNFSTGDVTKPTAGGGSTTLGNLSGTNLPLAPASGTLVHQTPAGEGTRGFSIQSGGDRDVLIARWAIVGGVAQTATYYLCKWNSSTATYSEVAIASAGLVFGYDPNNQYIGGVAFTIPGTNTIYCCRESGGTWYLERYTYDSTGAVTGPTLVTQSTQYKLIRPFPPENRVGSEVLYSKVRYYAGNVTNAYEDYLIDQGLINMQSLPSAAKLDVGTTGWAQGAYSSGIDAASGFELRWTGNFTGTPSAMVDLVRRYGSTTANRSWAFRINPDRTLQLNYVTSTNTSSTRVSTAALPGAWTDTMTLSVTYRRTDSSNSNFTSVSFRYSTDGGTTWTTLGSPVLLTSAVTILATTQPIVLANDNTTAFRGVDDVRSFKMISITSGGLIAGMDFAAGDWPIGSGTYVDAGSAGTAWSLNGDAAVISA